MAHVKMSAERLLSHAGISPLSFSHYGVVVSDADENKARLGKVLGKDLNGYAKNWVDSYKVYVLHMDFEGTELELIQPVGESFFSEHLSARGEGLQHVSFRVNGIEDALKALKQGGAELVDAAPRIGSHGKVAFTKPEKLSPYYLELCEY